MPQSSQIIGVNSVTNIALGKGVMPAPLSEMWTGWKTLPLARIADRVLCPTGDARRRLKVHATRIRSLVLTLYRIVANGRFTSGRPAEEGDSGWMAR
ncbi:hypothetical protein DJ564_24755 [Pseudomonas sp. 31-12]|nr:hypothetical protein DJ564_24755 [Pseudomonas sp. 31-12]